MTPYQTVESIARKHGYKSYAHYLESGHWSNLKDLLNMKCCALCSAKRPLLAHHIRYRDLIDVQVSDLVTMCFPCHDVFHLGCRKNNIGYVGVEIDEIAIRIAEFKLQPWFLKRQEKLKLRARRRLFPKQKRFSQKKKFKFHKKHPKQDSRKRSGNFEITQDGRLIYKPKL